jgi:hypothetical protein
MKRHCYTPEEIRFLKDHATVRNRIELTDMFNRKFNASITVKKVSKYLHFHNLTHPAICSVGKETMHKGYILVKIAEPNIWKHKHVLIWEEAHGPVPKGHVIMFADGNKSNMNLDNLLLVSKRECAAMNKKHLIFPDADATRAGLLIAKIIIQINDRTNMTQKYEKKRGVK